ncbi:protein IRX15-LIKE-like [Ananas comosus]|uniref:Protein IRX15-LIKE-like n=1 Tax=Ananas comosus TaxID=4615 RepID=A0A6P5F237_ANACO|nr:protein IRX15-LIKE-like [Ananas comosus]
MKGFNSNEKQQLLLLHKPASNGGGGGASGGGGGGGGGGSAPASPLALLGGPNHRLWLVVFLSFFTVASLLTLLSTARDPLLLSPPSTPTTVAVAVAVATSEPTATAAAAKKEEEGAPAGLAEQVFDALVHYAAAANASARSMTERDMRAVAGVLRRRAPCNLLVFGLGPETALWRALNHGGRTVFLDENEYYIAHLERRLPGLEAYDVAYTTRVADLPDLLAGARASRAGDCRPVQDLLFSECRLALNDLPNHLYDVAWDVVLVDGPRGYAGAAPGRMAPIFTAAVMAHTRPPSAAVDVLVHDYEREAERLCSEEFLCRANLVADSLTGTLAHFIVRPNTAGEFCPNATATAAAAAANSSATAE